MPDIESIVSALKSENYSERANAVSKLGETGTTQAVEALLTHLEDSETNPITRASIAEILGNLGIAEAAEPLLRVLQTSGDYWLMEKVVEALKKLRVSDAATMLVERLEHDENAWLASKGLAELGD